MRIAYHVIRQEIKGEKKYGIDTTGADELKHLSKKGIDISHATIYMPASFDLLEEIFDHIDISNYHHFIDLGCGKGRTLCVAANYGCKKVSGVELSKKLCDAAVENLIHTSKKLPSLLYDIKNNDAFYYPIPTDTDCIFLFNPFDEIIMSGVVQHIIQSICLQSRNITVIYVNPLYKHLFISEGFKEIYHSKKLKYLEVSILKKNK